MPRSVAGKVARACRTASTVFVPELVTNGEGEVRLAAGYVVARISVPPIRQASGQPERRDAA